MSKIGRNQPCPCGSGKKYKRCHGVIPASGSPPPHVLKLALERQKAHQQEVEKQFGLGRIVAVGPELHWSKEWKTFPDFLMSYFKFIMGKEWGEAELARPRDEWHPLFAWYVMTSEHQKKVITTPGVPQSYDAIGAATGILWLTYGLYLLRHNAEIQSRLLNRLRASDPVQIFGALHEVIVAAAMIRAGFELELENEEDGSQTHCEFTATSKITGKQFSVEVKVCDPGRTSERDDRSRAPRQLSRALSKAADHPRIVCIDLNRPMAAGATPDDLGVLLKREMKRIRRQENKLKINNNPAPAAYLILWNYPFRFNLETTNYFRGVLFEGFKIPRLSGEAPFTSIRELSEFNAQHADPTRFAQTLARMEMPSTLDGELPGRAFRNEGDDLPPILIGERYLVPDEDGREIPGELVSAVVMEKEKHVAAVVRLDEGRHIIVRMPINDTEIAIYNYSPDTFFGVVDNSNIRAETPVEFYEAILSVYKETPRERLLEFLNGHPNMEYFQSLPHDELAKVYAEGIAMSFSAKQRQMSNSS